MQIVVHKTFYSIGTGRRGFTTLFQNVFQKTKRAPFLGRRRRSSKSSYETIGQIKKPTNQTDVIIPQDRTQKCSRQVWFRTALGSSVIVTVSACSIRNRCIQFKQDFSCNFILTHSTANVNMKIKLVFKFIQLHN